MKNSNSMVTRLITAHEPGEFKPVKYQKAANGPPSKQPSVTTSPT